MNLSRPLSRRVEKGNYTIFTTTERLPAWLCSTKRYGVDIKASCRSPKSAETPQLQPVQGEWVCLDVAGDGEPRIGNLGSMSLAVVRDPKAR